jgi:hypothetical protein
MSLIKIVNAETGEEIEREMNQAELADAAELSAKWETEVKAEQDKAEKKAEVLERLGITEEEAKLLLS